jgi:hypothetical protein
VDFYLSQADIHRVIGASGFKFLAWAGPERGSFDNLTLEKAREKARTLREGVHQKPEDGGPVDPLWTKSYPRKGVPRVPFRQRGQQAAAVLPRVTGGRDSNFA